MYIRVAINTVFPDIVEFPLVLLFMADETGRGYMGSGEDKVRILMLLYGEGRKRKA